MNMVNSSLIIRADTRNRQLDSYGDDTFRLTPKPLIYVCINHGDQRVFSFLNHHKCQLFPPYLNTYVVGSSGPCGGRWCYRSTAIINDYKRFNYFGAGINIKRQILMYEDGLRDEGLTLSTLMLTTVNILCFH